MFGCARAIFIAMAELFIPESNVSCSVSSMRRLLSSYVAALSVERGARLDPVCCLLHCNGQVNNFDT